MTWEVLSVIGTVAFAVSGAIIAMEEEYDILGVYILGIVTAFGGGAIRNLLIGVPVSALWEQGMFFQIALLSITAVFLFPNNLLKHWRRWGNFFDAMGLSAFAIQGALYAVNMDHPMSAVIVAAVLTGSGGGIVRDLLAGRKPLVLRSEIYAVWAILAGFSVGLGIAADPWQLYVLFVLTTALRVCSYMYNWKLPFRKLEALSATK
ncbi:trimeric intracellular cation channel family protein [Jeotgalibacillus sp. S-D1]|uniref:trimeric intracellular cation channel family protein n=1 Tax=Jeotgalibacillus sp. S-D1 TaxID=2552189 RepID=UPI00105A62F1|nr:trimeric intracellular cation channel family protein [Jeotgalibacillus sp. S-D1]TDL34964.1 trimeric intracellular cation channel family protein [Jeotgalibacillus sp. S-D1]